MSRIIRASDILTHLRFKSLYVIAFQVLMFLIKLGKLNKLRKSVIFRVIQGTSFHWEALEETLTYLGFGVRSVLMAPLITVRTRLTFESTSSPQYIF